MEWPVDRGLRARMAATMALTAALGAVGAVVVYGTARGLVMVFAWLTDAWWLLFDGPPVAAVTTMAFLAVVAVAEFRLGRAVGLPDVDARPADRETFPVLFGQVDRLAQQVGLPRPTVAVTEDPQPLAFTTGFRPASATLVVSTGLLDALDDDELEAVVAHELAHVRNHDTAVMTAAALPTVVADGLRRRASAWMVADGEGLPPAGLVFAAAWLLGLVGHLLLSVLARYRELAADRGAVALTGSPPALASALETISGADPSERRDLRSNGAVAAFAIVDVDDGSSTLTLGPEGERDPMFAAPRRTFRQWFDTHPPMAERLERVGELSAVLETAKQD